MGKYPSDLAQKNYSVQKTVGEWTQIHSLTFVDRVGFPANTKNDTLMTEANFLTYVQGCNLVERIAG